MMDYATVQRLAYQYMGELLTNHDTPDWVKRHDIPRDMLSVFLFTVHEAGQEFQKRANPTSRKPHPASAGRS